MSNIWEVEIRTWPFSTNRGNEADKASVGAEFKKFRFEAETLNKAVSASELILSGIKTNPSVWQTFVTSLSIVKP